jgi:hypothetical protein
MPRANRHFLPGHVWHITHRSHRKVLLLKFAPDQRRDLHLDIRGEEEGVPGRTGTGLFSQDRSACSEGRYGAASPCRRGAVPGQAAPVHVACTESPAATSPSRAAPRTARLRVAEQCSYKSLLVRGSSLRAAVSVLESPSKMRRACYADENHRCTRGSGSPC